MCPVYWKSYENLQIDWLFEEGFWTLSLSFVPCAAGGAEQDMDYGVRWSYCISLSSDKEW
jgi:hypothetical protein